MCNWYHVSVVLYLITALLHQHCIHCLLPEARFLESTTVTQTGSGEYFDAVRNTTQNLYYFSSAVGQKLRIDFGAQYGERGWTSSLFYDSSGGYVVEAAKPGLVGTSSCTAHKLNYTHTMWQFSTGPNGPLRYLGEFTLHELGYVKVSLWAGTADMAIGRQPILLATQGGFGSSSLIKGWFTLKDKGYEAYWLTTVNRTEPKELERPEVCGSGQRTTTSAKTKEELENVFSRVLSHQPVFPITHYDPATVHPHMLNKHQLMKKQQTATDSRPSMIAARILNPYQDRTASGKLTVYSSSVINVGTVLSNKLATRWVSQSTTSWLQNNSTQHLRIQRGRKPTRTPTGVISGTSGSGTGSGGSPNGTNNGSTGNAPTNGNNSGNVVAPAAAEEFVDELLLTKDGLYQLIPDLSKGVLSEVKCRRDNNITYFNYLAAWRAQTDASLRFITTATYHHPDGPLDLDMFGGVVNDLIDGGYGTLVYADSLQSATASFVRSVVQTRSHDDTGVKEYWWDGALVPPNDQKVNPFPIPAECGGEIGSDCNLEKASGCLTKLFLDTSTTFSHCDFVPHLITCYTQSKCVDHLVRFCHSPTVAKACDIPACKEVRDGKLPGTAGGESPATPSGVRTGG